MTRLNMYDIIKEDEETDFENKNQEFIAFGDKGFDLPYPNLHDGVSKPTVSFEKKHSELFYNQSNVMRMYIHDIPLEIKDGRVDSNIVNTSLNMFAKILNERGYTQEFLEAVGYKFAIAMIRINVQFKEGPFDRNMFTFKSIQFRLANFITNEIKEHIEKAIITPKKLFSGEAMKDLFLPTIDMDIEKWYDIELKKLYRVGKKLLKGEVDGISYDLTTRPHLLWFKVSLDEKTFVETDNHIHPHFNKFIKFNLSRFYNKDSDEYTKVREDLIRKHNEIYTEYIDELDLDF